MLKPFLIRVVNGRSLSESDACQALDIIMSGRANPTQLAGFLVALRQKGESTEELLGFVRCMREHAVPLLQQEEQLIDTCGTGGDGVGTLNISTAAALVAAACGARVAKHGNRSVSSRCGSADLLEAWGLNLDLSVDAAAACLGACGITFLFAPLYHPAMKYAAATRKELGIRTVFNLLGPLSNPAGVRRQVLGVFDRRWVEPLANVLSELGAKHSLVVSSYDGLDEISPFEPTLVCEVKGTRTRTYVVSPEELGETRQPLSSLKGGDAQANAVQLKSLLGGRDLPAGSAVALNAGAALYVAGLADSVKEGVVQARSALKSGSPWKTLETWVAWTRAQAASSGSPEAA
jgi:anthranilate phosphoribosyltransferase